MFKALRQFQILFHLKNQGAKKNIIEIEIFIEKLRQLIVNYFNYIA